MISQFARRQLLRLRAVGRDVERVEVHPAVALGEEPDALVVGQELEARCAAAASPASRTHASSCSVSMTVVLPGLGVERHEPAVLVVRRSRARRRRACRRSETAGMLQRISRSAFLPAFSAGFSAAGTRRRGRSAAAKLAVGPHGLAGLQVEDRRAAGDPACRRRSVRAWDVLGVAGLGHVVRHDRGLRARPAARRRR